MPPRRSQKASKQAEKINVESTGSLKSSQNAFVNALASRGRAGEIHEVVIPEKSRKRKAPAVEPEPEDTFPSLGGEKDAEDGDEDDDDDAPEPVSLKAGKKVAEQEAKKVKDFEESTAAKRKEANRKRDQALKERAVVQSGKQKKRKPTAPTTEMKEVSLEEAANIPLPPPDEDELQRAAIARMERAMADAGAEDDDDSDSSVEDDHDDERALGSSDPTVDAANSAAAAPEEGDIPMTMGDAQKRRKRKQPRGTQAAAQGADPSPLLSRPAQPAPNQAPLHLPDHMFAKAQASIAKSQLLARKEKKAKKLEKVKEVERGRKRKEGMKERVVGSRTVRVLADPDRPDTGVKSGIAAARFVRQKLNLTAPQPQPAQQPTKGGPKKAQELKMGKEAVKGKDAKTKVKAWERRAAHLTMSLGSAGPARGFARSLKQ